MERNIEVTDAQRRELAETGRITWTPEQADARFANDYALQAFEYGLQYYGAGRFAAASGFIPITASLLHHAVELLLRGCLAQSDCVHEIRRYRRTYSHGLSDLWAEFRSRQRDAALDEFNELVEGLHEFEDIRYPENLIANGAVIELGFAEAIAPRLPDTPVRPEPRFLLLVPRVDKLVRRLFEIAGYNPQFFDHYWHQTHAQRYFEHMNHFPICDSTGEVA